MVAVIIWYAKYIAGQWFHRRVSNKARSIVVSFWVYPANLSLGVYLFRGTSSKKRSSAALAVCSGVRWVLTRTTVHRGGVAKATFQRLHWNHKSFQSEGLLFLFKKWVCQRTSSSPSFNDVCKNLSTSSRKISRLCSTVASILLLPKKANALN